MIIRCHENGRRPFLLVNAIAFSQDGIRFSVLQWAVLSRRAQHLNHLNRGKMSLSDYDDIDLDTVCPMTEEEVMRVQEKIRLLGAALPRPPMPTVRVQGCYSRCFG